MSADPTAEHIDAIHTLMDDANPRARARAVLTSTDPAVHGCGEGIERPLPAAQDRETTHGKGDSMTTDDRDETTMRVPPSLDATTPSERTPEPARVHRQMPNSLAPTACPCASCVAEAGVSVWWMIVCDECGNKRCPHGTDHRHECTGSNEPGQVGSGYARMTSDDRTETITDRAAIRDSDEPSERTAFPYYDLGPATSETVGALDLDTGPGLAGLAALLRAVETIKATGGAVEISGVRIEPCDEFGSTVTTARAEAAEAERDALRAKVAAVEALMARSEAGGEVSTEDVRAALATGEGK